MRRNMNGKRIVMAAMTAVMLCGVTGCGSSMADSSAYDGPVKEDSYDAGSAMEGFNGIGETYSTSDSTVRKAKTAAATDAAAEEAAYDDTDVASEDVPNATDNSRYNNSSKKIIKRYNYSYETEHFDDAYQFLKEQVKKYDGYVSNSEVNGSNHRNLYFEARIPADKSEDFVSKLGNLGTVTGQSESAEDVTLQYADTEGRIASLKTEQERLLALMEKADKLENIITLENRLTEVRYQLESFESQKKLYDDLVTYSTITINLREVVYTVEVDETSFITRVTTGFKKSLRDIGYDAVNSLANFIIALPHIVVALVKLFIIFLIGRGIVRLIIKKVKKSRAKKQEKLMSNIEGVKPNNGQNPNQNMVVTGQEETVDAETADKKEK